MTIESGVLVCEIRGILRGEDEVWMDFAMDLTNCGILYFCEEMIKTGDRATRITIEGGHSMVVNMTFAEFRDVYIEAVTDA